MEHQSSFFLSRKAALVVAHPGHELRVFHWLEQAHPVVFVLTDGSGPSDQPRLESTSRLLEQVGARSGRIFGRLTDRELYQSILGRDFGIFIRLTEELSEALAGEPVDYVAGDAIEGYNPAHDVCRFIVNAAVEIVRRRYDRSLDNFDFLLAGPPDACPAHLRDGAHCLSLNDVDFKRKINAAQGYAELLPEVASALNVNGLHAFRSECLRPVRDSNKRYALEEPPFYELHGEKRAAAGFYREVLRYREHMLPLAEAIRRQVEQTA